MASNALKEQRQYQVGWPWKSDFWQAINVMGLSSLCVRGYGAYTERNNLCQTLCKSCMNCKMCSSKKKSCIGPPPSPHGGKYRSFVPCPNVLEDTVDLSSCTIIIGVNKHCGGELGHKDGKWDQSVHVMNSLNLQRMNLCVLSQES